MQTPEVIIDLALQMAFEAGKWAGQVDMEEHYDREQYSASMLEAHYARRFTMPQKEESTGRTVSIGLRSDEWRAGVKKSSVDYLKKAKDILTNKI